MNNIKNILQILLYLAIALPVPQGHAEDIDIYSRPPVMTSDPNLNPNVLIVIDNSANWASANQHWPGGIKQGEAELNALRTVIGELSDKTNVGLMMFTEGSGGSGPGGPGGYVRFHVRQMTATNKTKFSELIGYPSGCTDGANSLNGTPNCILKNFNNPSEKVASAQTDYSAVMLDVFKYFGGFTWPAHAQDDMAASSVYGSSVENSSQFGTLRYAGAPDPKSDPAAYSTDASKISYKSPLSSSNNCAKNYLIFIGNGFPSKDLASTYLGPPSLLPGQGVGGDVTQLPLANLSTATTSTSILLATPACGTYPGADEAASLAACNADATFLSTQYPGYSNYNCTAATTCSAGSTTTITTLLGNSACGLYATAALCEAALTAFYGTPDSSYSCTNQTACTSTSSNPTNPIVDDTGYIADDLSNATNCTAYGTAHYPAYSGFSCTSLGTKGNLTPTTGCVGLNNESDCTSYAASHAPYSSYGLFTCPSSTNCGAGLGKDWQIYSGYKHWRIDATTKITTGYTYAMNRITDMEVSSTTYSQHINGTSTSTAFAPNGTFSAPIKIRYFDEWARFLHQTDLSPALGKQNLNTFTIDVFKDAQDADETSLLISAAQAGGGKYFKASDETAITNALRKIFSEIQSVNSVFASSSLPVSVNTQGTYLNQVFMGMFRPEGSASPRWPGNLKQYKFKIFNGVLRLSDKNGEEAISTTTGFVTPCADSYWTTDTGQYWNFGGSLALGDCSAQASAFPAAGSTSVYSDAPDGEVVEKGGAAQRLRGVAVTGGVVTPSTNYLTRNLKTCDGTSAISCMALTDFAISNADITATTLDLTVTDGTRDSLISWVRGQDVDNENANFDASIPPNPIYNEMRPSVHGGVVHSQPAVIDYGGTTGTVAFYGSDDGVFHAVDGGQTDTEGTELWGFIAPETMRKLKRLRTNSPPVAFPGVSGSPAPTAKDYYFDGSIGVYQNNGTVWLYPSMRRGGRAIYAFDVSTPASPALKWRKGCFTSDTTDDTVCSTGWTGIGQTWSHPKIVYLDGYTYTSGVNMGLPKPVLMFGGGYDLCEDTNSQTRCATTPRKGANIWFVDADTGNIIRTYPTHYSVPGDLAVLKNASGYLTYVYATDTGGNIYRINVGTTDTTGTVFTSWSSNSAASEIIIASLSEANHARKFMNGPSIVPTAGFNAVLVGSGDREHPLVSDYACGNYSTTAGNYVTNQFYMLMDKPAVTHGAWTHSDLVNVTSGTTTVATASGITTITNVLAGMTTSSTKGWWFNFGRCEQSVNEPLTVAGVTYFGTNAPSATTANSCTANLGYARGYAVDFLTANPIPASKTLAQQLASTATVGDATGPGGGVGASGEVINGVIAGAEGGTRNSEYIGGGMPPSPVAGVVDVEGTKYPFCIGCIDTSAANASALQGSEIIIEPTGGRLRAFWYMESD